MGEDCSWIGHELRQTEWEERALGEESAWVVEEEVSRKASGPARCPVGWRLRGWRNSPVGCQVPGPFGVREEVSEVSRV